MEVGGGGVDAELAMELGRLLGLQMLPTKELQRSVTPLSAPDLRALKERMHIRSEQVKDRVRQCISSERQDFGRAMAHAVAASAEFDSISSDFYLLIKSFQQEDSSFAFSLCTELSELVNQMRKVNVEANEKKKALAAVEHISLLHQKLTRASEQIPHGDLLYAAQVLVAVRVELGISSYPQDEDEDITHVDEARPSALLRKSWSLSFSQMSITLGEFFDKFVVLDTQSLMLHLHSCLEQGASSSLQLSTLLTAMDTIGLLEGAFAKFADKLFKSVVSFILHEPLKAGIVEQAIESKGFTLGWVSKPKLEDGVELAALYAKLIKVVDFLSQHLCCANDSWMKVLGRFVWPRMADAIISEYLSKAIPNESHEVAHFQDLAFMTNDFEAALKKLNFISRLHSEGDRLGKFTSNVELHFASKKKGRVLARARHLLRRKGLAVGPIDRCEILEELLFQPESCVISQAAKQLMEIVHDVLEDACCASSRVSLELYHAARDVFLLYSAIVPVKLDMELKNLSKEAIIYHNDCLYLAHESLGLVYQYREALPMELKDKCIFVDLYPLFKGIADTVIEQQLHLIGSALDQALDQGNGFGNTNKLPSYEMASLAIDQVVLLLEKVRMIWQPVMVRSIYVKSMGVLMESVFARLAFEILNLDDMDVKETEQLRRLIFSLEERLFPLLQSLVGDGLENQDVDGAPQNQLSKIGQLVPTWCKLLRLGELLDMSLVSITRAWESGNLVNCGFSTSEVQKLVKAVFSDTDLRKESLQKIATTHF